MAQQTKKNEADRLYRTEQKESKEPCFFNIVQNPQAQAVMTLGKYSLGETVREAEEDTTQIVKYNAVGKNLYMNDLVAKDMDGATLKIYCLLQEKIATDFNADYVGISIDEYMERTGVQKRSNAWNHLEHAGLVLLNTAVEGTIDRNKKDNVQTEIRIPICISADRRRDKKKEVRADYYILRLSTEYKAFCCYNSFFAPIHKQILKLPNDRPIAIRFGIKMCIHYNTNKPKEHSNSNTIKVKTLLKACKDIPPYEVVGRQYKQRIIKPVDENLELLCDYGILKQFIYIGANGTQIAKDLYEMTFEEFAECNVAFTFTDDYIEETKRQLEHAGKLIEKRAKAKEKREERKEKRIAEAIAKETLNAQKEAEAEAE